MTLSASTETTQQRHEDGLGEAEGAGSLAEQGLPISGRRAYSCALLQECATTLTALGAGGCPVSTPLMRNRGRQVLGGPRGLTAATESRVRELGPLRPSPGSCL